MNASLSRHYVQKACRQFNANRIRSMSTAAISSTKDGSQVWSGSLSFASPEADFASSPDKKLSSTYIQHDGPVWSNTLSFASPDGDFASATRSQHLREYATDGNNSNWSQSMSFSSPESDFVSAPQSVHNSTAPANEEWSESLSFASAESDFVSAPQAVHNLRSTVQEEWSESLSFASPESDFASAPQDVHMSSSESSVLEDIFRTQQLHPSAESATGFIPITEMVDQSIVQALIKNLSLKESLPKTVEDALNDERPTVITTADSPFRVVDVNTAWEGLCGYSREEAVGCDIGNLLQGPDTNVETADAMVRALQENGVSETVLTNYTKSGRRFGNRIQVGMIPTDGNASTSSNNFYLVGVLNEISESRTQSAVAM